MYKYSKFIFSSIFISVFCILLVITVIVTLKCCIGTKNNDTWDIEREKFINIRDLSSVQFDGGIMSKGEVTLKYADLIFSSVLNENDDEYSKSIKFDDESKVWIISYLPLNDETLGGSIDILISAKNGEVVDIIYGE